MSELGNRLISPHNFDGHGPVPADITAAARRIAKIRTRFLISDDPLTREEAEDLFNAAALQAEWMRELYEALHPETKSDAETRC